jgi:hypothetical protein
MRCEIESGARIAIGLLEGTTAMTQFIDVALDTEAPGGAGYVRYSHEKALRQEALDEACTVSVDLDALGRPVGIELTTLDAYSFALLERAGAKYGLSVPDAKALAKARR